jgi:hypothetical protein
VTGVEEGADALMMDGRIVYVRSVSEGDKEALGAVHPRITTKSLSTILFGRHLHRSRGPAACHARR